MAQTSKTPFPCDDDSGSMWPLQQQNDFVFVILSVLKVPLTKCNTAFPRVSGAMSDPPPPPPPPPFDFAQDRECRRDHHGQSHRSSISWLALKDGIRRWHPSLSWWQMGGIHCAGDFEVCPPKLSHLGSQGQPEKWTQVSFQEDAMQRVPFRKREVMVPVQRFRKVRWVLPGWHSGFHV